MSTTRLKWERDVRMILWDLPNKRRHIIFPFLCWPVICDHIARRQAALPIDIGWLTIINRPTTKIKNIEGSL
jgi:hypothetical protein